MSSDADFPAPPDPNRELEDNRGRARGWGRLVVVAFWICGIVLVGAALIQLFEDPGSPKGPRFVTLFAGLVYLGAAVGLTHNGRRMRRIAWACTSVALAGPIIVGLAQVDATDSGLPWSPWNHFGLAVGFASILLPLIGLAWLWWSNPSRIVQIAEGVERPSRRERSLSAREP